MKYYSKTTKVGPPGLTPGSSLAKKASFWLWLGYRKLEKASLKSNAVFDLKPPNSFHLKLVKRNKIKKKFLKVSAKTQKCFKNQNKVIFDAV